jgi:hypothetical protein
MLSAVRELHLLREPDLREPDADDFAGEVTARAPARPRRAWVPRLAAAVRTGVRAGLLPAAAVFAIYFVANRHLAMPWAKIASILAVYGPAVGVSLSVLAELLVMAFDRAARAHRGLAAIANPVTAGALAGALAGIVPGAVGVTVFGSFRGPFAGTGLIAGALIAGCMLVAVPIARRARRARWPGLATAAATATRDRRALAAATAIATLILCAIAAVVAPLLVHGAFARTLGTLAETGPTVGAITGIICGGIVGVFVGLVIALGRSLYPLRAPRDRG